MTQPRPTRISDGIRIAIRHPSPAVALLAQTFSQSFENAPWIDTNLKIRFCIMLLDNYLESSVEERVGLRLIHKLRDKPLEFGIRLLKRDPQQGLEVLVGLVLYELRLVQLFDDGEQRGFITELLHQLFPEFSEEDHSEIV
jgi:hypothetical protein